MVRGRKPKPTALKDLHGSEEPRNRLEPKPVGDLTAAPDWFDERQRASWDYAIRHSPPGLMKLIDRSVLTAWCVAECLHRQATEGQGKMTDLIVTYAGSPYPQQSPYLAIINRQALIMAKLASEMGFSPSSRPRIYAGSLQPGAGMHAGFANDQPQAKASGARNRSPVEPATLADYLDQAPPAETFH